MRGMIIAVILAIAGNAVAQEVTMPAVGKVDLAGIVGSMRASVLLNSQGATFYGAHVPIVSMLGKTSGVEYVNINAGVVYSADMKQADFMASTGFRLDSLISKLGRKWPNLKAAALPPIEVGPFASYGFNRFMWGGMFSLRLGGK